MSLKENGYKKRLVDDKIKKYLNVFGAVCIVGPKWCGKTWTSLNHANSVSYLTDEPVKQLALINPKNIFSEKNPQLIDEWQIVPSVWDAVRHECDRSSNSGLFILTGSTTLKRDEKAKKVFHSGAGRIAKINMETMSLYESGDSTGIISIRDMLENKDINKNIGEVNIKHIADLVVRGGWPKSLALKPDEYTLIPKSYLKSILENEINDNDKQRDINKMKMLIKSLARNESTLANNSTLLKDIDENQKDAIKSKVTLLDYLDLLERLYLIKNQECFSLNYRSKDRVGKTVKRHFVDPSLAVAALNLNADKLLMDIRTFSFLFESLVVRDLRIYMDYLGGNVYHFRDNVSGLEVDSILEFEDGEYAAVEIKLGYNEVNDAIKNLQKYYDNTIKKPKFMCVIVGVCEAVYKDPSGIYIVPITALKP